MGRRYDRREVEEILRRAVGGEVGEDGLAHEDLVAAAAEVGVSAEAVERAATELAQERERVELAARVTRRRRQRFVRRFVSYLGLCGLLFAIDRLTGAAGWWYWAAIGLAFPLLRLGLKTFLPSEAEQERALEIEAKRLEDARTREARRARRLAERARKRGDSRRREAQFEQILERAVDALLSAADKKLTQIDRRDVPPPPPPNRVRVEPEPPTEPPASARTRRRSERSS